MANDLNDLSKPIHVQDGDPVGGKNSSQPTRSLELQVQQLRDELQAFRETSLEGQIIIPKVPIKTGVAVNDIVFFNGSTGLYEKALAGVTFLTGTFTLNPTALGFGVVVAVHASVADVQVGGYRSWTDNSQKEAMLESTEDFVPGIPYYLSAKEPGKLTRHAPALRIQILMATDKHFVVLPMFSSPDAIESIFKVGVGMRPVGSTRPISPDFAQNVIVGFDALEKYNTTDNLWRMTRDGAVTNHKNYGYMIADAVVDVQPSSPVFVRVQVAATTGAIKVFSASSLAELEESSGTIFNVVTSLTALANNKDTVRSYVVTVGGLTLGTLRFKFADNDVTLERHVIFEFPTAFQGWKMIYSPVTPIGTAVLSGNTVSAVSIAEGSIGYNTPPDVVFSGGGGTGAAGTAVLNEFGSIIDVTITNAGTGYTSAPTVTFVNRLSSIKVINGGTGAAATVNVNGGGEISGYTITNGGTGYHTPPTITVVDQGGNGSGAVIFANVHNGVVTSLTIQEAGSGYVSPKLIILPGANTGYQKTKAGQFTVNMSGGAITSITVVDGGANYPAGATARTVGGTPGVAATLTPVVNASGVITAITVNNGGSGYSGTPTLSIDVKDPVPFLTGGGSGVTPGTVGLTVPDMNVLSVDVLSAGGAYAINTTLALSGGLLGGGVAATIEPVIEAGSIVAVKVISPGSGYFQAPTVVITDPGNNGNHAQFRVNIGTFVASAAVVTPGSAYSEPPAVNVGVPLSHIEVELSGTGYGSDPAVTIGAPDDPNGVQALATATRGGVIKRVLITNGGTGYDKNATIIVTPTSGGTGASVLPIIQGGVIVAVEIVDAGTGYLTAPTLSIGSGGGGSGAVLVAEIEDVGGVAKITLTRAGTGYVKPPTVTVAAPGGSNTTAKVQAKLVGKGAVVSANISGFGGLRATQASVLAEGNAMQITSFVNDLTDLNAAAYPKPKQAAFYYNFKADPEMRARYPSVPLEKTSFILNGVEQNVSVFNEATRLFADVDADLGLTKKTLLWPTFDVDGSPWDREHRHYIFDLGSGGRDHVIQKTGPAGVTDEWWRLFERVFKYETNRNRAWLHVNRASRFFQSTKVSSLGALSPLRIIDVASGVESKDDGTPLGGQLLLVLDNQVNILGGTSSSIDLTRTGDLQAIYINETGRPVFISSFLMLVAFQLNKTNLTPTVSNNARVTIGTQEGNYRDIVGTIDPNLLTQVGVDTRLYDANQVKELFPDNGQSYRLIQPGQVVFLRVDSPAGDPILKQIVTVKIKGHVL